MYLPVLVLLSAVAKTKTLVPLMIVVVLLAACTSLQIPMSVKVAIELQAIYLPLIIEYNLLPVGCIPLWSASTLSNPASVFTDYRCCLDAIKKKNVTLL